MTPEEIQYFEEGFNNAVKPLMEWLQKNCPSTTRAQVMHRGAELSQCFAWYVPKNPLH